MCQVSQSKGVGLSFSGSSIDHPLLDSYVDAVIVINQSHSTMGFQRIALYYEELCSPR